MGISAEYLRAHVHKLAAEIGQRNVFRPQGLRQAAEYIEQVWLEQGYEVVHYLYDLKGERWANLEVSRYGKEQPSEIILIGAHYDSVVGSPGANDNGSGVAALLELSSTISGWLPGRTVRFVAFVNEEPAFFQTSQMGSRVYAHTAWERSDDICAMISLETIGYYSNKRGSQHFPPLFNLFYPSRGNFIIFVSNLRSRALLRRAVAAFRAYSDFPAEGVAAFGALPGVGWSDHSSFWRRGYRALMVTDTAPYRYPYYHTAQDTPDRVNYEALARVTEGLLGVVARIAAKG
jgi:Zn-dependent M28 family amino/carboxypeptidase